MEQELFRYGGSAQPEEQGVQLVEAANRRLEVESAAADILRLVRDVGLGMVDRLPRLKGLFIKDAAGLTGAVPRLLRGEAL